MNEILRGLFFAGFASGAFDSFGVRCMFLLVGIVLAVIVETILFEEVPLEP